MHKLNAQIFIKKNKQKTIGTEDQIWPSYQLLESSIAFKE